MTLYVAAWIVISALLLGGLALAYWREGRNAPPPVARWEPVAWVEAGHVVTGARRILGGREVACVEVDRVAVEEIDIERAREMAEEVIASATWRDTAETHR